MRLGHDARPSPTGELSRVCAGCLAASDDRHTAADVTKLNKIADAHSRWAEVSRAPPPQVLQLHVAGEVVRRSRTELFRAKRAQHSAGEAARVGGALRAYVALGGTSAERSAAGVLEIAKARRLVCAEAPAPALLQRRGGGQGS